MKKILYKKFEQFCFEILFCIYMCTESIDFSLNLVFQLNV